MGRLSSFVTARATGGKLKCPVCSGESFHESGKIGLIPDKVPTPASKAIDVAYLTCKTCMLLLPFDLEAVAQRW